MHQYIYIKIYILRAFQILKYLVAPIFIRVHSLLFLYHFSTATFTLGVQILVTAPEIMCKVWWPDERICQLQCRFSYYYFRSTVDFVVLLFYLVCVDKSGSLSGGAFNQLKLVTLNIVLTILYSLKPVSQRSLLQCLNSSISLTKSSNIYSRHPHCNIK